MNKVLGLDVGKKRIGVSVSDFLLVLSHPLTMVLRKPEKVAIEEIKKLAHENQVNKIVVGLPLNEDGSMSEQAEDCRDFAKNFEGEFEIIFEDEFLTSSMAEDFLRENKKKYTKNKHLVDIASACIILQQYLDRK